ncbi:MAG: hypothetical protein E7L15_17540 [Citrobacter portucalensis]|nr:hypothetical protein [Citrobacter portucalensis]
MKDVIGIMKCKSAWFADFKVRTMKSVNENDKDKIGWVGIKDNGDEYHVYCKHWDFEPVSKWKYLKGSEKDFAGAHAGATHKYAHKELGHPVYTANPEIIKEVLFNLVAVREPIAKEDVEVVKYDHTKKVDIESLVAERGNRYGKFKDGAEIMRDLKHVMHEVDGWNNLSPSQKEALDMIQHKIGRILNGDPNYDDNWKDIAGYAKLIADELNGEVK